MFGHQDNQQDDQKHGDMPVVSEDGVLTHHDSHSATLGAPPVVTSPNPALPPDDYTPPSPMVSSDAPSDDDDTAPANPSLATSSNANDLLDIKQQALQQLTPLVDHLDQTPEEKFRTYMMMIQAADNQALIKTAYEAADKITDEKARAQALLDIVNEINYFTQQDKQD
ncbi:MAG TPA: hypothetical protein VLG37_04760 [Candidatus Saccharimonadales bacterium]|nr:hypothetical protein [Candidatus Saccharimonadales bacterium]